MDLTEQNSLLTGEQIRQLNNLLQGMDARQIDWLSGYLIGRSTGQVPHEAPAKSDAPSLTILYGSQTGNTEDLAQLLSNRAAEKGLNVQCRNMADYKPRQLKKETHLAILTSTHGEGDPPDNALDLYEFLHSKKASALKELKYAVLALGDSTYEHFCQTGKDFDARLSALGATALVERVDCDVDYDEDADAWMTRLLDALPQTTASGPAVSARPSAAPAATQYDRKKPFYAPLLDNQLLNGRGSNKEVRHIELSLEGSGLRYQPGDSLGIYPQNDPSLVAAVIDRLQLDPERKVTLDDQSMPLHQTLQHHREIAQLTRPLVKRWAELTESSALREKIENHRELMAWMRGRDLLDLLTDWPAPGLDAETLVGLLRKLPPRLYSIASSQSAVDEEVHLTVAAVRYQAHNRQRLGVASTWLADRLDEDASIPVYVDGNKNFKLPPSDDTPMIMIGPGTGVAPFRAFMQEREARGAEGRNWLFFGDQHFRTDFLYQSEWLSWRRQGLLSQIDVAFSRDGKNKHYVQHRLRERAQDVWRWIQEGASIYVCGDADAMAPDVNEALTDIAIEQGAMSRENAKDYLRQLTRDKRYQRDVY